MTAAPVLESSVNGDRLELSAGGAWTSLHAAELEALVEHQISGPEGTVPFLKPAGDGAYSP